MTALPYRSSPEELRTADVPDVAPHAARGARAHPVRDVRPASAPRVAICVATCMRPRALAALLDSFHRLVLPPMCAANTFVVVIDNDESGSARAVTDAWRERLGMPLIFAVEPIRNIARARNRSVREALRRGADLLAFIDDDEVADPHWLRRLLEAHAEFEADAVCGAVIPVVPPATPQWLRRTGFFDPTRSRTGSVVKYVRTNNVLVSASLLRALPFPFDPAFGLSGGSDSLFFAQWQRRGARFLWVDEAVVEERVPASRARAGWILQRAFRVGNMAIHCERALPAPLSQVAGRTVKVALRLAFGIATLIPLTVVRGRSGALRALWNVCYGAGGMAALTGYRYYEYRLIHGE